jgi:hypothetical protein
LLLLAMPNRTLAQNQVILDQLQIEIWPEYDRQAVLVIYRGVVSGDVSSGPIALSLRIPTRVGEPNAVAVQEGAQLFEVPYERLQAGEWATIRFSINTPTFQLEYYDPELGLADRARKLEYIWPADVAISDLQIIVQQPAGASGFELSLPFSPARLGADGLSYHQAALGSVPAGEPLPLDIRYERATGGLSVDLIKGAQALDLEPVQADSGLSSTTWLTGGLLLIGFVGALVYWYGATKRARGSRPEKASRARARRRVSKPATEKAPASKRAPFCHECGSKSQPDDRFCRSCGAGLRLE